MKFEEMTKLSDLLDYAIKDHEASGLKFAAMSWLKSDCGCLAGGVMHQTLGIRLPEGQWETRPSKVAISRAIKNRLLALSYLVFGQVEYAEAVLAGQKEGERCPSIWPLMGTLDDARQATATLRSRGL
jgi:hypothetical protein